MFLAVLSLSIFCLESGADLQATSKSDVLLSSILLVLTLIMLTSSPLLALTASVSTVLSGVGHDACRQSRYQRPKSWLCA